MKKLLIALICSISMNVYASDYFCRPVIYCPNADINNCKNIPSNWHIYDGALATSETLIFSKATLWPLSTNVGECIYKSKDHSYINLISDTAVYQADKKAPGNRWDPDSLWPICYAYLYPQLCPFTII